MPLDLEQRLALSDKLGVPRLQSDLELKHAERVSELAEKFYRAIWAIDPYGQELKRVRHALMRQHQDFLYTLHMKHESQAHLDALEKVRDEKYEALQRVLDELLSREKDRNRSEWEKQRDFMCGTARRVLRASRTGEVGALHFYLDNEMFKGQDHEFFGVARDLWHAIREELKMGITVTVFRDRALHQDVAFMVDVFRRVIGALEHNDPRQLQFYTKSPLHLSPEQEGRRLWEGTRIELNRAINLVEKRAAT